MPYKYARVMYSVYISRKIINKNIMFMFTITSLGKTPRWFAEALLVTTCVCTAQDEGKVKVHRCGNGESKPYACMRACRGLHVAASSLSLLLYCTLVIHVPPPDVFFPVAT